MLMKEDVKLEQKNEIAEIQKIIVVFLRSQARSGKTNNFNFTDLDRSKNKYRVRSQKIAADAT